MPRSTRNFWVDLMVDDRTNTVGTGPRSKNGGFKMSIYTRENNAISDKVLQIEGYCTNNKLRLFINDELFLETER